MQNKYILVLTRSLLLIGSVSFLLILAFYNRYPIIFSDVGTYVRSGFTGIVPVDRPIFYGLFLRHISLAHSLWFVAIAQSLLTTLLIFLVIRHVFNSNNPFLHTFVSCTILSLTTSVSYVVSHIMPDFFLPVLLLSIFIFLFANNLNIYLKIFLGLIIIYSCISHLSNLLISIALLIVLLLTFIFINKSHLYLKKYRINLLLLTILIGSVWIIMPAVNYLYGIGFKTSRTKNIFLMANFIDSGILQKYLSENCSELNYDICENMDELSTTAAGFLWYPESVLYKDCGSMYNCWEKKDAEYGVIINDILKDKYYLGLIIKSSFQKSLTQVISFGIDGREHVTQNHASYGGVKTRLNPDFKNYRNARQAYGRIEFHTLSMIQYIVVSISIGVLLLFMLAPKLRVNLSTKTIIFIFYIILALIINSFVTGTFSGVVNRYQNRIIWLIPFIAIALILDHFVFNLKREDK